MARESRPSVISCCHAGISSCSMLSQRYQQKRLPSCVMLLCLHQSVCFPLPCLSLPWIRCMQLQMTLLSRRLCTRQGFSGNPHRGRSRQPRHRSLLLTVVQRLQKPTQALSSSAPQQGQKKKGRKGNAPFLCSSGRSGGKRGGARKQPS